MSIKERLIPTGLVNIVEYTPALANVTVTLKRVQIVHGMYPTYRLSFLRKNMNERLGRFDRDLYYHHVNTIERVSQVLLPLCNNVDKLGQTFVHSCPRNNDLWYVTGNVPGLVRYRGMFDPHHKDFLCREVQLYNLHLLTPTVDLPLPLVSDWSYMKVGSTPRGEVIISKKQCRWRPLAILLFVKHRFCRRTAYFCYLTCWSLEILFSGTDNWFCFCGGWGGVGVGGFLITHQPFASWDCHRTSWSDLNFFYRVFK